MVAGVAAPAVLVAATRTMTLSTALLLAVWMFVPLHAAVRVLGDVRHAVACWSASVAGARHARSLNSQIRNINYRERDNPTALTGVTQGSTHHRTS
jgi:hypothetical protein